MVLGFMTKFPWGEPTNFREKILHSAAKSTNDILRLVPSKESNGFVAIPPKLHTIRTGGRWKPGQKLHMANGVRTKQYSQFNKDIPELQEVKSVQRIDIFSRGPECVAIYIDFSRKYVNNGKLVFGREWFEQFLQNDGLTEEQFFRFFKKSLRNGQLIWWVDQKN